MGSEAPVVSKHRIRFERDGALIELAALDMGDPQRPVDVVFLHANGFNAATYRSILLPLSDRLRIVAVDQQGHGGSPQRTLSEGRTDALIFRDDLIGLLDQTGGDTPLVLSGHSLGGCVALLAAASAPERVKALTLFDPVILPRDVAERTRRMDGSKTPDPVLVQKARARRAVFPSREAVFASYRGRGAFATWPDEVLHDYIEDAFRSRGDGEVELTCAPDWEAANFAAHGHDTWGAMEKITVPVTILRAETGSTCALTRSGDFPGPNPDVQVTTVAGASHFLPMERPDLVRAALLRATGAQTSRTYS